MPTSANQLTQFISTGPKFIKTPAQPLSAKIPFSPGLTPSPYSTWYTAIGYPVNFLLNGTNWFDKPTQSGFLQGKISKSTTSTQKFISIAFLPELKPTKNNKAPMVSEELKQINNNTDLALINLETGLSPSGKGRSGLEFDAPTSFFKKTIDNLRLDPEKLLVSLANNHGNDGHGPQVTLQQVEVNKLGYCIGTSLDDRGPLTVVKIKDLNLGVVACTRWMNYSKNVKNYEDYRNIPIYRVEDIEKTNWAEEKQKHKLSALILYIHCGREQSPNPFEKDIKLFDELSKSFDVIVGHGPHTLHTTQEKNESIMYYSIGDLTGTKGPNQVKVGGIANIELEFNPSNQLSRIQYKTHLFEQRAPLIQSYDPKTSPWGMSHRLKALFNLDDNKNCALTASHSTENASTNPEKSNPNFWLSTGTTLLSGTGVGLLTYTTLSLTGFTTPVTLLTSMVSTSAILARTGLFQSKNTRTDELPSTPKAFSSNT